MGLGTLVVGLVALLFGAAFCFAGFRYFKILLPIWGFIAGFWVAEAFIAGLLRDSNTAVIIGWVVGLVAGLLLAWLSYSLLKAAMLIFGATFGLWLVSSLMTWIGLENSLFIAILAILGGILFAVLTLQDTFRRYLIIIFSALIGATGIVAGLMFLFGQLTVDMFRSGLAPLLPSVLQESSLAAVLWIVLAVLGAAIQWLSVREIDVETQYATTELDATAETADDIAELSDEDSEAQLQTADDMAGQEGEVGDSSGETIPAADGGAIE